VSRVGAKEKEPERKREREREHSPSFQGTNITPAPPRHHAATQQNTATSFVSFLGTVVPIRSKTSRKLVSEDRRNNVHRNQHTMVVEIAPLCKVSTWVR
jgi:hypothetical protein